MPIKYMLILIIAGILFSCKKSDPVKPAPDATDGKTGMLLAVNTLRLSGCKCGADTMQPAPALKWNDTLALAASTHALDMYYNTYFSHIGINGSLPVQRAVAAGYSGHTILENIAKGYTTLADVINAWQNSEGHCKAIMDSSVKEMGAARANEYWVQEFGDQ